MSERRFKVLWTEAAVRDLEDIVGYIAADSPLNAARILGRMRDKAKSLETVPRRGRIVPDLAHFGLPLWRELIVGPYRTIYRIEEERVYVLAVLDSRRDLEDFLLERLLRF